MKKIALYFICFFMPFLSNGQIMPIELMLGNRNYWYQHSIGLPLKDNSKFGFFHTHSTHFFYDNTKQEVMTQAYLNYKITPWLKMNAGVFYVTKPGINPSVSLHISKKFKDVFILLVPRIDVYKNPGYDLMSMVEYKPRIGKIQLYTRLQTLFSYKGNDHSRSYQNIRLGIDKNQTQYGIAVNYDAYGPTVKYFSNYGVFVKRDLNFN